MPASPSKLKRCEANAASKASTTSARRVPKSGTHTQARKGIYDVPPDLAADAPWDLTFTQPLSMVGPLEGGNLAALAGIHGANSTVAPTR